MALPQDAMGWYILIILIYILYFLPMIPEIQLFNDEQIALNREWISKQH